MNKKFLIPLTAASVLIMGATGIAMADDDDYRCKRAGYGEHYNDDDDHRRGGHWKGMGGMGGKPAFFKGDRKDKNLDEAAVRDILEGQIAWHGMDNLKVGDVTAKDDQTIIAKVVTKDDSPVWTVEVNRKTGRHSYVR